MAYLVSWRNGKRYGHFSVATNKWKEIEPHLARCSDGPQEKAIVVSICPIIVDDEARDQSEFRVTNTTTGAVHRFDYRSEAESFYDAAVAEYGPLHGYEFSVLIKRHSPPEMLGAGA